MAHRVVLVRSTQSIEPSSEHRSCLHHPPATGTVSINILHRQHQPKELLLILLVSYNQLYFTVGSIIKDYFSIIKEYFVIVVNECSEEGCS